MKRAVTIRDVAQRAGVSRQTVSRAINGQDGISLPTRERVLSIARELGYRPSSIARSLKTHRTLTIGLVVPDIANPFFAEVARGASEVAYSMGYSVLLGNTDERPDRERAILRTLEAHRVDGLALISSRLDDHTLAEVTESARPVVLVNRLQAPSPGVGYVLVNDADAATVAVQHLLGRGHRRIGFLAGSPASRSSQERRRGYWQAMQAAGLFVEDAWCVSCAPNVEGGRQAAHDLLSARPALTALLAYNDLVAVGARQACETLGRSVPDSCALVGWDDIIFASYVSPPLTTMRTPKYQMGERAMQLLLDLIEEPERALAPITLEAELVVRLST